MFGVCNCCLLLTFADVDGGWSCSLLFVVCCLLLVDCCLLLVVDCCAPLSVVRYSLWLFVVCCCVLLCVVCCCVLLCVVVWRRSL